MTPIRMGVVGVGALGQHHARILSEMDRVNLVGVSDTDEKRAQQIARKCQTNWCTNYKELCDIVDAVSIVVPTTWHLQVAEEFIRRRIPVLIEKPLALNAQQAERLVELSLTYDTLLQVGHIERFNPVTKLAWSRCGSPRYIRAERYSPYAFRSTDIGAVLDLMIHDIDLVLDLTRSPIVDVEAFGISILGCQEDSVNARLKFASGCIADLTANRVCPDFKRMLQIWSEDSTVSVDFNKQEVTCFRPSDMLNFGTSPLELAAKPNADIAQLKKDVFGKWIEVERPEITKHDALTVELDEFIDCCLTEKKPEAGGQEGLAAMHAAEMILDAVNSHRWTGTSNGLCGPHVRTMNTRKMAG